MGRVIAAIFEAILGLRQRSPKASYSGFFIINLPSRDTRIYQHQRSKTALRHSGEWSLDVNVAWLP